MSKRGRPTKYNEKMAARICKHIAEGKALISLCKEDGYPHFVTVFRWFDKYPEFCKQYAKAKEIYAERVAEEIISIADDTSEDEIFAEAEDGSGQTAKRFCNKEFILRSRLRVDARKWIAARLLPKKYGDKQAIEHSGPDGDPIPVKVFREITNVLTPEDDGE